MSEISGTPIVDVDTLRNEVRGKYRAVAKDPDATYHFHTGRPLAIRLRYDGAVLQFADVANGRTVPPEVMRDVDLSTG